MPPRCGIPGPLGNIDRLVQSRAGEFRLLKPSKGFRLRGQRLDQYRLFTAMCKSSNGRCSNLFSLSILSFHQEDLRSSVIRVSNTALITKTHEQIMSTSQVLVSFRVTTDLAEKKTYVVLDACLEALMTRLFKMKTCCSELYKCAVNILGAIVCGSKALQKRRIRVVELSFQCMVRASIEQWCSFFVDSQCLKVSCCNLLDDSDI